MAISLSVVALLLIGVMATSVLASKTPLATDATYAKNTAVSNQLRAKAVSVAPADFAVRPSPSPEANGDDVPEVGNDGKKMQEVAYDDLEAMDGDELKDRVLVTYEETDARITTRVRFLLYTHDGEHVMWGYVGNGYFVGQDNQGKNCWGIYGNGVFAGFYDNEFFWGKYRCGNWKAIGLFGENYSFGKYVLFPTTATHP